MSLCTRHDQASASATSSDGQHPPKAVELGQDPELAQPTTPPQTPCFCDELAVGGRCYLLSMKALKSPTLEQFREYFDHHPPTLPIWRYKGVTSNLGMTTAETEHMPFYLRTFFRLLSSWVH